MKKLTLLFVLMATLVPMQGQNMPKMDKSPMDAAYFPRRAAVRIFEKDDAIKATLTPVMRVTYSRPQVDGRTIFGDKVKYGEIWRIGANENTELLAIKDVRIGGAPIAAGRYSMYAIPNQDAWTIIINKDIDTWGGYAYDEKKDVARVTAPVSMSEDNIEALSIAFTDTDMVIGWEKTQVKVPVSVMPSLTNVDASPMDMAYFPSRAVFRAWQPTEELKAANAPVMRVSYSRPNVKGRKIFGDLVKYGEVWRMGANENAELHVMKEVKMGGESIPAGRYSLHAVPGEDEWTFILNSDVDGWGSYKYVSDNDVARFKVKAHATAELVEAFTINFTDNSMVVAWENTMIEIPVEK